MTDHAKHPAPRSRWWPVQAVLRFLDDSGQMIEFFGAVAGLVVVTTLAIRAVTAGGIGLF